MTFNLTKPEWQDVRVRTALGLAIDREVIVKQILKGGETPAYTFVQPNIPAYPHEAHLVLPGHDDGRAPEEGARAAGRGGLRSR